MTRLFTSFYAEQNAQRRREILQCLDHNLRCSHIDQVCLLLEDVESPVRHDKLSLRTIQRRPTYADFFDWINEIVGDSDMSIVSNSDIYFDDNLRLVEHTDMRERCFALSRWDVVADARPVLFERGDSQDCWLFQGPVKKVDARFPIGVYDCDNKIAWELDRAGYNVENPAFSLRSYHLHQTEERSYDPESPKDHGIRPPFKYIQPDNIGSLLQCARLWRTARMTYFPYRLTRQKLMRTGPLRLLGRVRSKCQRIVDR